MMKKTFIAALIVSAAASGVSIAATHGGFSPIVDDKGTISFPQDLRTNMVHLGSWFVPEGGASGFHGVYTEKSTVEAFRKTGKFPDGATLVKELRAHDSGNYTTGSNVSHETASLKQWFVMVKDSKGRFSDNGSWGDGWGWALFKPDNLTTNASSDYKMDCLGCHVPAKDKDWIYTEAYPILAE
ncbi:cytochrome P460 family protein [Enterovibrio sp. ZSDZ42]|uniref:Cytochrome P460 family protein n=1 Tax=Enterovibrio gelatinilyticus TaxID=2899819 RepID=A0ABT5R3Y7_9GAMM|nr:cytochrome P460 family protein [Enterovibrio sp. ZSDZ42]MDD1794983.1 cytochrome P460 family protein [Enterovibrio sp. ZSDZ42]